MIGNNIWDSRARSRLLHVIPQHINHAPLQIRGSRVALRRLGNALIDAAESGKQDTSTVEMMASDGEGYNVEISPMSDQQMEDGPLPYAQLGYPWDFERCWNCDELHAAREEVEEIKRDG